MKLLIFTDLHLSFSALKILKEKIKKHSPDILVCAGDISLFEEGLEIMLEKLSKLRRKVIIIHGNHETPSVMKKLCSKYKNLIFIDKKVHIADNTLFLGHGGGGFSLVEKSFKKVGEKFSRAIKKNPTKKVVFLTHAPPHNTKLDKIEEMYCGNKTYHNFIAKNRIDLCVCGHIHENAGKKDELRGTTIINPGPKGKIVNL